MKDDGLKSFLEEHTDDFETGDDSVCSATKGEHMPNWATVTPADGAPGIVDVTCLHCGRSGSAAINPEDIQW